MKNGKALRILTIFRRKNEIQIKYRSKNKIISENLEVNILYKDSSIKGEKIKVLGEKTFEVVYKGITQEEIVKSLKLNGLLVEYVYGEKVFIYRIRANTKIKIYNNTYERVMRSSKCINLFKKIGIDIKEGEGIGVVNNKVISTGTLKKYKEDKKFKELVDYTEFYEESVIEKNTILYECFHGKQMGDSPYAIFRELIDNPKYKGYTHIWALNNEESCEDKYKLAPNVKLVKVGSTDYMRYLASAEYLINNTTFPPYYIKKEGQIYVNTWHGTPLKTLGKYMKGSKGQHKNIQRNLLQADYLINPNKFTADVMLESHDIDGIYNGYVAECGYPRVDMTVNCHADILKKRMNLETEKKIILYAPTWRGEVGNVDGDIEKFIKDYERLKEELDNEYEILLRVHSLMLAPLKKAGYGSSIVSEKVDTNELLGIVDVLITDYSSIMFDYMVTKKPLALYCYDFEKYSLERGLIISLDEIPAKISKSIDELIENIKNIEVTHRENNEKYKMCLEKYNKNDDGLATKRFIEMIFEKDTKNVYKVKNKKKNIIMYCGGFLNNGITTSAINLLNNIDYEKYNVMVVDKGNYNDESKENVENVNIKAKIIYRVGNMLPRLEEVDVQNKIFREGLKKNILNEQEMMDLYNREYKRLFGSIKFDIAIDFSGYVKFWTLLFACAEIEKKLIYQHNDMTEEYKKIIDGKFKHRKNLDVIFPLYNTYDHVVSVAKHTCEKNKEGLMYLVNDIDNKFIYVHNSINYKSVLALKDEYLNVIEIEDEEYYLKNKSFDTNGMLKIEGFKKPNNKEINFINIGRMSPEKDQIKLIYAFNTVVNSYSNTKLYMLGDGILKNEIENVIKKLKLEEKVILTGQIKNPFTIVKECNCFVLSSNHEGQPMVLLENLILNKDIIATDIPGNRSVLEEGYGKLVNNDEESLATEMLKYCKTKKINRKKFDYVKYNEEAMKMFYKVIELEDR
ncbi:MAG: CDP-glycerol glycerophosphotransferase family protein [Clostridium sp.]